MSVLPFLKLRARASPADALRLSLGATAASLVVPVASMVRRPSRAAFELGLLCSALSFFLLSFQASDLPPPSPTPSLPTRACARARARRGPLSRAAQPALLARST